MTRTLLKYTVPLIALGFLLLTGVSAQSGRSETLSFIFYTYLDKSRLVVDDNYPIAFDILGQKYTAPAPKGDTWTGKVFNFEGNELDSFNFYPKNGANKITVPYHEKAIRVAFYNPEGHRALAVSVDSGLNFCDFNGVCRSDLQENGLTCPNDCPWEMPVTLPSESPKAAELTGPVPSEFSFVPFIFLAIFFIIGFIVGYIVFRQFKAQ